MSPRRRRCLSALSILLTGILATVRGGAGSYLLFECAVLIPCLSLVYLAYVYLRFRVFQFLDVKTMMKGQKVPYTFVLSNEDRITYCDVRITFESRLCQIENLSPDDTYCLLPGTQINKRTFLSCSYRGKYQVGIDKIVIADYLGLFSLAYRCSTPVGVTVLPRVIRLDRLAFAPKNEVEEERTISLREEIPNMQIRQYVRGDSMHRIHWKASAKTQELMTREYTEEPRRKNLVILDLRRMEDLEEEKRLAYEDKILECALSIGDYFVQTKTPIEIMTEKNGIRTFRINTEEEYQEFYAFCAEVDFGAETGAEEMVRQVLHREQEACSCMVLTGFADAPLFAACLDLQTAQNRAAVYYVGDEEPKADVRMLAGRLDYRQIYLEEDTKEALEG